MIIGSSICISKSCIKPLSHINSVTVLAKATYFASVNDRAIVGCFLVVHDTVAPKTSNKNPEIDFYPSHLLSQSLQIQLRAPFHFF